MKTENVDLLLLNCTNLEWRPIFPYAFVQVSEVASRFGISVKRQDLLYVENWEARIKELIKRHNPTCIGLHIRQIDTLDLNDYLTIEKKKSIHYRKFYPLRAARRIIEIIRKYTTSNIILGGFGFTSHAENIANYLEVDLGVRGCPDGFLDRFNDVLIGRDLSSVPGLMYHDGQYIANLIENTSPAEELEYNPTIISEIKNFYGEMLDSNNPPTIAVEVARGCPFSCYFCTEPDVKGKTVRRRNIDTVKAELEHLLENNLNSFWFVCSELNIGGAGFVIELANMVNDLSGKRDQIIQWSGYSLPSLSRDEMEYLNASGYVGAMNDLLSLDDENLRKARVPYKKEQAIDFLISMSTNNKQDVQSTSEAKYTANSPNQFLDVISMFLGNAYANKSSISNTLEEIEKHQLSLNYNHGHIIPSTRVFPIGRTKHLINTSSTISIGPNGREKTDTNLPTFYFPNFLIDELKDEHAILEFFDFISSTYLSNAYKDEQSLTSFVISTISRYETSNPKVSEVLEDIMLDVYGETQHNEFSDILNHTKNMTDEDVLNLSSLMMLSIDPYIKYASAQNQPDNPSIEHALRKIFEMNEAEVKKIQAIIGITKFKGIDFIGTAYRFAKTIFQKFGSIDEMRAYIDKHKSKKNNELEVLYSEYLIFITRANIADKYRNLITTFKRQERTTDEYA